MSEVASAPAPSAKVCCRMARWSIVMDIMTTTQPETSGFIVQLNSDQDSARQNFFHRFSIGILIKKVLLALAALTTSTHEVVGAVIFFCIFSEKKLKKCLT